MTRADLEAMQTDFFTSDEIAAYIGCSPHGIRVQAQDNPDKLGFPVTVIGSRVRIPKMGFLFWLDHGKMTGQTNQRS